MSPDCYIAYPQIDKPQVPSCCIVIGSCKPIDEQLDAYAHREASGISLAPRLKSGGNLMEGARWADL